MPSTTLSGDHWSPRDRDKALAWLTHLITATGAVWGFLALLAISQGRFISAFLWLFLAVTVDAFDGLLARRVQVKRVLPEFDGALLDNIIDYQNYVLVPAFLLHAAGLFPARLSLVGVAVILLSSAYQFCQSDAKTEDHYFKGFPSYWNIVAFYIFVLASPAWLNFILIAALAVLVFVPIKYIYPSRTEKNRPLNMALAALAGVANLVVLFQYTNHAPWLIWLSLAYVLYYAVASLSATRIRRDAGRHRP